MGSLTPARKISYLIFAIMIAAIIGLHLGLAVLFGLFSYMILDLTNRQVSKHMGPLFSRSLSLLTFIIVAFLLGWLFSHFLKQALSKIPSILGTVLPKIDEIGNRYGLNLPFQDMMELRAALVDALKEHSQSITKSSGILTRGIFQALMGIFVAMLCFISDMRPANQNNLFDAVRLEFDVRMTHFMRGFEKVFAAQILVALINTGLTGAYLLIMEIPYVPFLMLTTFVLGLVPIIGNVLSNTCVVGTALTISPKLAVISLGYLVFIHKTEYLLYTRIVGPKINTPMWQILIGILIGEALIGLPGIVLAPAILHYIREEMTAIEYKIV